MPDSVFDPIVSIVIPTKNAGPEFRKTLQAIRSQTVPSAVFVVDSGSADQTLDLAGEFGAQITCIPPENFNHGDTRNLGLRQTTTPFGVMLVQDALPVGETWLESLLSPFSDEQVVGVTAKQIPRPDSDPIARWQVEYRIQFLGDTLRVQRLDSWEQFLRLDYQGRLRLASFDNVCSAVRMSFWREHPFHPVNFAEDLDWGLRAIQAGRALVYNPAVSVIHSHNRPAAYHLKRSYVSGRIVPKILHMTAADPGIPGDLALFGVLGDLCGEARTLVAAGVADWRDFGQSRELVWQIQEMFRIPACFRRGPNYLKARARQSFYFILDQLLGRGLPSAAAVSSVVPSALGEAMGVFIADYYNWCEAKGGVSESLRRLDTALSKGV